MTSLRSRIIDLIYLFLDVFLILTVFILENINTFFRTRQFPDVTMFSGSGWAFVPSGSWLFLILLVLLQRNKLYKAFLVEWSRNWVLIVFMLVAMLSILWTIYLDSTLYKLFFLILSTLTGSYIAVRFNLRGVIKVLTWIAAICVLFSFILVLFTDLGIMWNEPFTGSWNGMFWHRNHTGSLMAFFNLVFLVQLLFDHGLPLNSRIVFGMFYVLTAVHVFGSRSAAGIIVFLALNFASVLCWVWLRWRARLRPWHYYAAAGILMLGLLILVTNAGFFFGLLGRTPSMTGRAPLWKDLVENVYLKNPFIGYGYGALWMQLSFRIRMMISQGWEHPIYFADNGFLDILLNLGLLGFLPFITMLTQTIVRVVRQLASSGDWKWIFVLLSLLYVILGNLTYSFLLEVDQFVWMILVIMVFVASKSLAQTTDSQITVLDSRAAVPADAGSTRLK